MIKILVAIINHNCNKNALKLKRQFSKHADVCLIDSGSQLSADEAVHFDKKLDNVYYSGMLNAIEVHLQQHNTDWLLVIASDVHVSRTKVLLERIKEAAYTNQAGLYAPSVPHYGSNHPHMRQRAGAGMQRTPFVDGFCFAIRRDIFLEAFPVNATTNYIGWGLDIFLGYLTWLKGYECVVDHAIAVDHTVGPNNLKDPGRYLRLAKEQRKYWYQEIESKPEYPRFKWFRQMMNFNLFKNSHGAALVRWMLHFKKAPR